LHHIYSAKSMLPFSLDTVAAAPIFL